MAFIASTEISGTINSRKLSMLMPILEAVNRSGKVRGLLIHLNSSGGEANASEVIFRKILEIREKKPVISYVTGICASGAYWIASASSKIYAMETSLIGSIGVISISPNVRRLMERLGVDVQIIKAGEFKDSMNPFGLPSEAGREKMEKIIKTAYNIFWNSVSRERKIPDDRREIIATGEIFSSHEAMEYGLIDTIGGYSEALSEIQKLSDTKKIRNLAPRRSFVSRFLNMALADAMIELLDSTGGLLRY